MKIKLLAVALGLLASVVLAEVVGNPSVAVTSASSSVTFATYHASFTVVNNSSSANTVRMRVFCDTDTIAAVVWATGPVELAPGESWQFGHGPTACGRGYKGFSAITEVAGQTATLRYVAE